jgi:hypothetical protein
MVTNNTPKNGWLPIDSCPKFTYSNYDIWTSAGRYADVIWKENDIYGGAFYAWNTSTGWWDDKIDLIVTHWMPVPLGPEN